jgi:succinate dehydrogenase / fumarate reductase membrane anchor subunit
VAPVVKGYAKLPVGAHYGTGDWLLQRFTGLFMGLYTVAVLACFLWHPARSFVELKAAFAGGFMRLATTLFAVALAYHAWVGMRDILMDYVRATGMRLALQVLVGGVLIAYVVWSASILWGLR